MRKKVFIGLNWCFLMVVLLASFTASAQQSVLATGTWHKLGIESKGVYRINQSVFRSLGFPANADPRKIKIYTHSSGMLPQLNSTPRPQDLVECAIYVEGEADGVFNSQDYILFYAEGPDKISVDMDTQTFRYEKHLYAKENFYFITLSENNGKRIGISPNLGSSFPLIQEFDNYWYHEVNQYNILKSGREWYGERFELNTEQTLRFPLSNITANSPIKLISDVMSQSFNNTSFNVFINGSQVGQHTIAAIPNTQYGIKGRHALDVFQTTSDAVSATNRSEQEVRYQFIKSASNDVGYLNNCLLQVKQQLQIYGNQTSFRSIASTQQTESTFQIGQATSQTQVWDVTNPTEALLQESSINASTIRFGTNTTNLKEFIVFNANASTPRLAGKVTNQNLHGLTTPHLLIITHPEFRNEAMRLKAHRESHNSLDVVVVTTEEVYNEFSGGKQDITALRDFTKYLYDKQEDKLNALLLFGKCSYDYNDVLVDNKNFVPTYQSRNSLHPLLTYSSDDFFTFLEDHEGEWGEVTSENHTLDIAVGRIPVKSVQEATNVVNKLIYYDTDSKRFGKWRTNIVFVADDGDFNIHQSQADQMARTIDQNHGQFNTSKIYLDAFPQIPGAGGTVSPEAKKKIEQAVYDGALVINYTGHGSERQWAQERILDEIQIQTIKNKRLPLLVTATCEFGRQDDPVFPSGGELFILQPNGGAIGLVTTARPVSSSTNFELNQAFYDAFFQKENGFNLSLGEIFRRTKNNSISGVANRNFSLIGDPSMHLAIPEHTLNVNSITTSSGDTTLKALSTVTITGDVVNYQNEKLDSFNGIVEATVFDKETAFQTLGNENTPFAYKQWFNAIFRGRARIDNGSFTFEFIVPKNIAYAIDVGKLSLYAFDEHENSEAAGSSTDFTVGSSEPDVAADTNPPDIKLFLHDPTFADGGITNSTPVLVAHLTDESGINISGYGIGNSIIAILDDHESLILNEYYVAEINDYSKGTIEFALPKMEPGTHTLTLRAWDTHNNPGVARINFVVSGTSSLTIESFRNYPNPVTETTQLYFTHNQAGNDLEARLAIHDRTGQSLLEYDFAIPASTYEVNLLEWTVYDNSGKKLPPGLYLARLIVRSLADGSKNERVTKLIIVN